MNRQLLSIDEVARRFNVSSSTVRRWVRAQKLPGQRAGSQWRFDPDAVEEAFRRGALSGIGRVTATKDLRHPQVPEWAKSSLAGWQERLHACVEEIQPQHVVAIDRTGAKVWALLMSDPYRWGYDLWHSTAIELMTDKELERLFTRRVVLLFDELVQHGREMNKMREKLESVDATVRSIVCVRRRSHVDSGELIEYEADACEDLDDREFGERATLVSRLVHVFVPPLDVDHLVVRGTLNEGVQAENMLENLAKWGLAFVVWHPDKLNRYLAITLDRPQFFDVGNSDSANGFSLGWEGPCKIRFYIDLENRLCYCSFITYPEISGSQFAWAQASAGGEGTRQIRTLLDDGKPVNPYGDEENLHRAYTNMCMNMATRLLNDFIVSGAASEAGVILDKSLDAVELGQLRATFGVSLGEDIGKLTGQILGRSSGTRSIFAPIAQNPPRLLLRESTNDTASQDTFACRTALVDKIPARYEPDDPNGVQIAPKPYGQLFRELEGFSESTIGRVLDYELDRGTIRPILKIDYLVQGGATTIRVGRGFCRGEFGVWFEWNRNVLDYDDTVIQRTIGLGPTVIESFLARTGKKSLGRTHFNKIFANLQHDWRENNHNDLYLGWKPYKYGPVVIVPNMSSSGQNMEFERFLMDRKCMVEVSEQDGSRKRREYIPATEDEIPWRQVYKRRTNGVTRAHLSGLVRLYATIQQKCTTLRPAGLHSSGLSVFQDPLVVLASARNQVVAYRCGWFEVYDWRNQGRQVVFPLLNAIALRAIPSESPTLHRHLRSFAAPPRLLFDKIEMYRNIGHLRKQIDGLLGQGDFETAEVVLETTDQEPQFDSRTPYPMRNLEWACTVMRSFSSWMRQVLTACKLDSDDRLPRDRIDDKGNPKDAKYYLSELLVCCPELTVFEKELQSCIKAAQKGILTEDVADCLSKAFYLVLKVFDTQQRIPDPRPNFERDRERLQVRDGLLTRLREIAVPDPYAVSVSDITNVRNLPNIAELFGTSYDKAMDGLLSWVKSAARAAVRAYPSVILAGLPADNVILAGPDPNDVLMATLDLIRGTRNQLATVDKYQFAPLGLLRVGIAWRQSQLGPELSGLRPGLVAYGLGDSPGGLGSVKITSAVYDRLSPIHQKEFDTTGENSGQGAVYCRHWVHERDSR